MKTTAILTATLGLALGSLQAQTVPLFINYQGKVTDSTGTGLGTPTPVNRKVIFRIFDAATAGNRLWSEQHTVTISNGEFSVLLGNGINANYSGADETPLKTATPLDTVFTSAGILRFVEIVVDNGDNTLNATDAPIAPRQQITSTAYSFRARSADTITSGTDLQLNSSANYGLGYYGPTRLFNGVAVDGPVLFGLSGGALGSVNGGTKNIALQWDAASNITVGGSIKSSSGYFFNPDTDTGMVSGGDGIIDFKANSGTVMRMNAAGNVGIGTGTANPSDKLHVKDGNIRISGTNNTLMLADNTNIVRLTLATAFGGGNFSTDATAGDVILRAETGKMFLQNGGGASAIAIATNNNVGIGNADPANNKLHVRKSLGSNDATLIQHQLQFEISSGLGAKSMGIGLLDNGKGVLQVKESGVGYNDLLLNPVKGNVGIGTPSPSSLLSLSSPDTNGSAISLTSGTTLPATTFITQKHFAAGPDYALQFYNSTAKNAERAFHFINKDTTSLLSVLANGNVGIGTIDPTQAKLVVNGSAPFIWSSGTNFYAGQTGSPSNSPDSTDRPMSIYCSGALRGTQFIAQSDERVKRIAGRSDAARDLATIAAIEVSDYTFIDSANKGTGQQKKVIAQQVEKVYPQAVIKSTDVVPDIYQKATVQDGWVTLATDLKVGERVRLIGEKEEAIHEVLEVREGAFRTAFQPATDAVFVYGREVRDFRNVDYEAIAMLNVSATQQIKKEKDAEVKALREENSELRTRLTALEAKNQARDAKMASIEKLLGSPNQPATRTISLKQGE